MHIRSLRVLALVVLFLLSVPAFSKPRFDVDTFLRTANLFSLVGNFAVLNLGAQMLDPDASTSSVDDLNDFVLLGNPLFSSSDGTNAIEFDNREKIIKKIDLGAPWLGVKAFIQWQIPNLNLQEGLRLVQICMAAQGDPTPTTISRLVIYRTLNTLQTVYDYVFKDPDLQSGACREVLYTPINNTCQRGHVVNCHLDYENDVSLKKSLLPQQPS